MIRLKSLKIKQELFIEEIIFPNILVVFQEMLSNVRLG